MSPLINILNHSQYYFYFLVVDEFLDISLPQLTNLQSISPRSLNIDLREKNSGVLLSHQKTIEYIKTNTPPNLIPAIIPFKASAKVEKICQKNGWKVVASESRINRIFEDKIKFSEICQQHQLPQVPNFISSLNPKSFQNATDKFGNKLVIQTHFGWAGNSTHLATSYFDAISNIAPGTTVKFSPYLSGYSLLNNCCLTKQGLIQSPPALQFTGLPELTQNIFSTTGRQWPSFTPPNVNHQIKTLTEKFSLIAQKYGFRGFFGLDFFVYNDQVFLLECNPRLTASFAFYTYLEIAKNLNPLFLFHILELTNLDYPLNLEEETKRFDTNNLVGAELTRKDKDGKTIAKYNEHKTFTNSPIKIQISQEIFAHLK